MPIRHHHRRRPVCRGDGSSNTGGAGVFTVVGAGRWRGKARKVTGLKDGDLLLMAAPAPPVWCPVSSIAATRQCALTSHAHYVPINIHLVVFNGPRLSPYSARDGVITSHQGVSYVNV